MAALKFSWCCVNWLLLLVLMALDAEAILRPTGKETDAVQQRLTPVFIYLFFKYLFIDFSSID